MKISKFISEIIRIIWIVSRLLLSLLFFYSGYFVMEDAGTAEFVSGAFFVIFALSLFWIFFAELFRGGANKWFKIFTGSISMTIAVSMCFASLYIFGFGESLLILSIPLLILLTGLYDLLSIRKPTGKRQVLHFNNDEQTS